MGTESEPTDGDDTEAGGGDEEKKTINDPLTRGDVEAPRAEFQGRTPESE